MGRTPLKVGPRVGRLSIGVTSVRLNILVVTTRAAMTESIVTVMAETILFLLSFGPILVPLTVARV